MTRFSFRLAILAALIASPAWAEDVTLTTYYPAPYGNYDELTTTGQTLLATDGTTNVGIGTLNPRSKLEIAGNSPEVVHLLLDNVNSGVTWNFQNVGTNYPGRVGNLEIFNLGTNNGIVLASNGRVGIGTTTPTAKKLHISSNEAGTWGHMLRLEKTGTSPRRWDINIKDGSFIIGDDTVTIDRFFINTGGGVGINANNPLDLEELFVRNAPNSTDAEIFMDYDGVAGGTARRWSISSRSSGGKFMIKDVTGSNLTRVAITTGGNVGINRETPQTTFDVNGNVFSNFGSGGGEFILGNSATSPTWHLDNNDGTDTFRIFRQPNLTTAGIAHFYITNAGNVGIGVGTPTFRLQLPNTAGNAGRGRANAWTTYSSARWKTNIMPISDPLEKVLKLRGVYFDWKDNPGTRDAGLVAEEVREIIPEAVDYDEKDGATGIDYGRVLPFVVEAIKTLEERNRQLEKRIEELEAEARKTRQ